MNVENNNLLNQTINDTHKLINQLISHPKIGLEEKNILEQALALFNQAKNTSSYSIIKIKLTTLDEWDSYDEMNELCLIITAECIKLTASGYIADKYVGSDFFVDKEIDLFFAGESNNLLSFNTWRNKFINLLMKDFNIAIKCDTKKHL